VEILQLPALTSLLSGKYPATELLWVNPTENTASNIPYIVVMEGYLMVTDSIFLFFGLLVLVFALLLLFEFELTVTGYRLFRSHVN
jgi:hypothetical protein